MASRIVERSDSFTRAFAVDRPAADPQDQVREAFERGRREGLREAEHAADERIAEITSRVTETLGELGSLSERLGRELEARFVELALEAAMRIVRERIEAGDPIAARALAEAIEAFPRADVLRARLNPADLKGAKSLLAGAIAARRVELEPDESIARGGCVVSASSGTIDATLGTALESIRSAVHETVTS